MKKDETMDEDKPLTQKMTKKVLETDTETKSESNKKKNIEISKQSKYNNGDQELEVVSSTNSDKTNQFKLSRPKHNHQNNRNTHAKKHRKKQYLSRSKSSTDSGIKTYQKSNNLEKSNNIRDKSSASESNDSSTVDLFNMKEVATKMKTPCELIP